MKRKPRRRRLNGPIHGRIASLREQKKLSQSGLAAIIGVHETAVSHWELGVALPSVDRLPLLASALDTSVSELIAGEKSFEALASMFEAKAS